MAHEVAMPQLSQSVVEGEITRWLVKEGDTVELDQTLAEIVTDKVDVELPSPVAGTVLKIVAPEGATVTIGTPLLYIGQEGESLEEGVVKSAATYSALTSSLMEIDEKGDMPEEPAATTPTAPARQGPIRAAPIARKMARELGVDLAMVAGTGPGGRIIAEDIEKAAALLKESVTPAPDEVSAAPPPPPIDPRVEYIPYIGRRRQIGNRLARSTQTIPHASTVEEIDVSELVAIRGRQKDAAAASGTKLTFLAYFVRAAVHTLQQHPEFNATLEEDHARIAIKKYYNIGIAVDAKDGLIVPVLRDADQKKLLETASAIQTLAEKARAGTLEPDDVQDSTFTISSVGGEAILLSVGVINAPEVALLNLHRIERRPVAIGEDISIRSRMYITLTIDHRVLDGGHATRFLRDFKNRIEDVAQWAEI